MLPKLENSADLRTLGLGGGNAVRGDGKIYRRMLP